ncbi:serine hydrolase domain-containing protein [Confluentibacter citreus]|uniref:serine hydrolase domain-containing protein n=1 Tax=Confluentibacter citreus TaxID=2007307 RepID=UPI000C28389A|nr:serine hydrolase domain-containing protein [Confluentibacter citreus]
MKNTYIIFLMAFCTLACNSVNAFQSNQNNTLEQTIDLMMENHNDSNTPGATIGIIKEGKIIFQKGYGMADLKFKEVNSPKVLYNIASGSKQFTAFAVTSLIKQQKLSLTDTIGKFLPEFPNYGKGITIENLLYHTSGIRDYMVLMWLSGKSFEATFDNKDALNLIVRQNKLNFNPGDRCVYSNSNYILLAEIIHRVTGRTLAAYCSNLLKDLNMNSSGFGKYQTEEKSVIAKSYSKSGDNYLPFKDKYKAYGDGGMHTTMEDLARWDQAFYDSTSPVQHILKRGTLNNGNLLSYGMGIQLDTYRNEPIQTHPGAFLGFRSETLRFPERKISIICLGNSEDINPESITRAIADIYVFGDKNSTSLVQTHIDKAVNKSLSVENAMTLTGVYEVMPNVLIHIRYEDGMLSGQVTGQPIQMLYTDNNTNTFKIGVTNDRVEFSNLRNGKYQELTVLQTQGNTTAQRLSVLSPKDYSRYIGSYYSKEQKASYQFYSKDKNLYFKVGSNPEVEVQVLTSYNRIYFDYKNLEKATIDFSLDSNGDANGFLLSSDRVSGIEFVKK